MKTFKFAQGSPEHVEVKLGIATASNAKRIITPAKLGYSAQAADYQAELIAEKLTGGRDPWKWEGETVDMQRGTATEGEARMYYQMVHDVDVELMGFCLHDNERWGCSPDGLVGEAGGLELKCPAPKTQVRWLADGIVPVEHLPQIHHSLIVTGRAYWDFLAYCKSLPPLLMRVEQNDFTAKLREYLLRFDDELDAMLAKIIAAREPWIMQKIAERGSQLTGKDASIKTFVTPHDEENAA